MRAKLHAAVLFVSTAAIFSGCGATKDISGASDAVTTFHARLDSGDYTTIYSQADQVFRNASKQQEFLEFMAAIHRKLGRVNSAKQERFFVNYTTSGTRVRLNYTTKFTGGDAEEEFVWAKSGNDYTLAGYHINSMALITK